MFSPELKVKVQMLKVRFRCVDGEGSGPDAWKVWIQIFYPEFTPAVRPDRDTHPAPVVYVSSWEHRCNLQRNYGNLIFE